MDAIGFRLNASHAMPKTRLLLITTFLRHLTFLERFKADELAKAKLLRFDTYGGK